MSEKNRRHADEPTGASGGGPHGQDNPELDYRVLFECAPGPLLAIDQDTVTIIDANEAAASMYGGTRDELIGMSVMELSLEPEESRQRIQDGTAQVDRRPMRRKDGTVVIVEIGARDIRVGTHKVRIASVRDITQRMRLEAQRDSSERKFAAAFSASPDAVNISRLDTGIVVETSDGFTAITGFTREDVIGKSATELGLWAETADRDRAVEELKAHGAFANFEADFMCKDGSRFAGLASARIIEVDGMPHILSVTRDITARKRADADLARAVVRRAELLRETTRALGRVVEIRDPYTSGHQERVALVARAIAIEMGLSAEDIEAVEMTSLVHDVGKLSVPAEILNKPGHLSDVEFSLIKGHSELGFEILKDIEFPWPVAEIVFEHHERMDGSGYPRGLLGEETLQAARIIAVADVVEAMASHRPYRPSCGLVAAIAEITGAPEKYDATVSAACIALYGRGELKFLEA